MIEEDYAAAMKADAEAKKVPAGASVSGAKPPVSTPPTGAELIE
jgi:hypothetical protein